MRLGAPVFRYKDAFEWAEIHVKKGYGAAYWPLANDAPNALVDDYIGEAKAHHLVIAEVGVWNNLMDPDPERRARNFDFAVRQLQLAEHVGARCCVNISGSVSAVWDGPDPKNLTEETFQKVVEVTQRLIDAAKPVHTAYALEPMPWMYPTDLESTLRLIKAVNRKNFGVHVDMCNMMNSYEKLVNNAALIRAYFEGAGPHIRSVHAKDSVLSTKLTLHIDEAIPGEGVIDYGELLRQCAKLHDMCILAEHLSTEAQFDRATDYIKRKAAEEGLTFTAAK